MPEASVYWIAEWSRRRDGAVPEDESRLQTLVRRLRVKVSSLYVGDVPLPPKMASVLSFMHTSPVP